MKKRAAKRAMARMKTDTYSLTEEDKTSIMAAARRYGGIIDVMTDQIFIPRAKFYQLLVDMFAQAAKDEERMEWLEKNASGLSHEVKGKGIYHFFRHGDNTVREWIDMQIERYSENNDV